MKRSTLLRPAALLFLTALSGLWPTLAGAQDIRAEKAVVFQFRPQGDVDEEDFQEKLIEELNTRGAYDIVSVDSLERALKNRSENTAALPDSVVLALAERFGAKMTVTGALVSQADGLTAETSLAGLDPEEEPIRLPSLSARDLDPLAEQLGELIFLSADAHRGIRLGINFYRYRAYDRALDEFSKAVERMPDLAVAHYWEGLALKGLDSLTAARNAFQAAVENDPQSRAAKRELANVIVALGDTVAARRVLLQMVETQPDDPAVLAMVGYQLAFRLGDREGGLAQLKRAQAQAPDYADAYKYLALLTDDLEEKRTLTEAYFERVGQRLDTATTKALLAQFVAGGQVEEATRLLTRALVTRPDDAGLNFFMGYLQQGQNQPAEAVRYYTRVIEADSVYAREQQVYLYRGLAYKALDQTAQMEADLSRLAEGGDRASLGKSLIALADQAARGGNCAEALDYLDAAEPYAEGNQSLSYFQGAALTCLGESIYGEHASVQSNRRALDYFRQALEAFRLATDDVTFGEAAGQQVARTNQLIERAQAIIETQEYQQRQGG